MVGRSAPVDAASASLSGVTDRRTADRLVWIDCEMTGLDLGHDRLIEVAVVVTDSELVTLDAGLDIIIHTEDDALAAMLPVVKEMHTSSGLTDEVRRASTTLEQAERQVVDYVKRFVPEPRTAPLCGNSIATDRGFLSRDMPTLDEHLHYRMIDVSSIKELARRWYPRVYHGQPTKGLAHRALADILESIQELRYYRESLFVPSPGPSQSQIQAVVAALDGPKLAAAGTPDASMTGSGPSSAQR